MESVTTGLADLKRQMKLNSLCSSVRHFSGDGAKSFKNWIKDMNQMAIVLGGDASSMKTLCARTLKDSPSDFFARICTSNDNVTWDQIQELFKTRYCDYTDTTLAQQNLRAIKQRPGESLQSYFERVGEIATEAFTDDDFKNNYVKQQLTDIYVDGLSNKHLARQLVKQGVKTIDEAFEKSIKAQVIDKSLKIRQLADNRDIQDMEIDMIVKQTAQQEKMYDEIGSIIDKKFSEIMAIRNDTRPNNSNKDRQAQPAYNQSRNPNNRYSPDGVPLCNICLAPGHIARNCYQRQQQQYNNIDYNRQAPR